MKFVVFEVGPGRDLPHVKRALASAGEVKLMWVHAPTLVAVRDQECIRPERDRVTGQLYERVLTSGVEVWRHVASELYAFAQTHGPDDRSDSQVAALRLAEDISEVVDGERRYF